MSAYLNIPAREVGIMQRSLFRIMPADPTAHLYRATIPIETLPETGERESLVQVFAHHNRRLQQRQRALAWLFQRRGIET